MYKLNFQLDFNKKKKIQLKKTEELSNENRNHFVKYLFNLNSDKTLLTRLEEQIREALSQHRFFLNANLPPQFDIEIVRETKTEQLEHYLRKDNKFFFKTIQELFLSEKEKHRKNKQDKISAESSQRDSLLGNIPRIKLSTDYAKEFNPKKTPIIFDKFLTELRKSVPNSIQSENINESSQIITELIVLHESAHIILDNKINKTYLKLAYEIKDKTYDGITTYLAKENYNDGNVSQCYKYAKKTLNIKQNIKTN